jgi:hypothetical protein
MLATVLDQTGVAAYFVFLYLVLTSPIGAVLSLVAISSKARGPYAREPLGVPQGVRRGATIAAVLAAILLLVVAGYHGAYWMQNSHADPPHIGILVGALLLLQIGLTVWAASRAKRHRLTALWGAVWIWTQLVIAFVAFVGPVLGAL